MFDLDVELSLSTFQALRRPLKCGRYGDQAVIIELGTHSIKIKHYKEDLMEKLPPYMASQDKLHGNKALRASNKFHVFNLIDEHGFWKCDEKLREFIKFIFRREIDLKLEEHRVTVIVSEKDVSMESLDDRHERRCDLATIILSVLSPEAYFVAPQSFFSLKKFNVENGVVINVGHSGTTISVSFNGKTLPQCCQASPIGGKMFDEMLFKALVGKGLKSDSDRNFIEEIKHDQLFVTSSPRQFKKLLKEEDEAFMKQLRKTLNFGKGCNVDLTTERFMIPEALFDPQSCSSGYSDEASFGFKLMKSKNLFKKFCEGQAESDLNFDINEAMKTFKTFVITGGSTRMKGMIERIREETRKVLLSDERAACERNDIIFDEGEARERLELRFLCQNDETSKGYDSFIGAHDFALNSRNTEWILEKDLLEDCENVVINYCPV